MRIVNMNQLNQEQLFEAAQILTDELPVGWEGLAEAMKEIKERLIPENTLFAAIDNCTVVGWGGILPIYNGKVFELHPLAVKKTMQGKGVGKAIVMALEDAARERGGLTMYLGADDEVGDGETSLANIDLYDNFPKHIQEFEPGTHQTGFYLKLGYRITGVIPDANGLGKLDILMTKRLITY